MTQPIKPAAATDEEIADLEWSHVVREQGGGRYCDSCGEWAPNSQPEIKHKPTCDSILIPKVKARIDTDRARIEKAEGLIVAMTEAMEPFASGGWGRIKAMIVNGALEREEGLAIATKLTEWNCAVDEILARHKEGR